jgi:hypothetical protein
MDEEGPTMVVVVILVFGSADVGVGVSVGDGADDDDDDDDEDDDSGDEVGSGCGESALIAPVRGDLEASAPPIPPPTAATTTIATTMAAIQNDLRRSPHNVAGLGASLMSIEYATLWVSVSGYR